jgi:site-specific recombinase
MTLERKVYAWCLALAVLGTIVGACFLGWSWSIGAPAWLLIGLVLVLVSMSLTGYMAWRALHGIRPAEGDRIFIALKLLSVGIFLSLFGPRLWAVFHK